MEKKIQSSNPLLDNCKIKQGWEVKKLGEVLKLEYGKPLSDEKRKLNGKYPVYGANGQKDRTDEYYFDKPSIIIGRKGSAGEVNLSEEKFWPLDVTYFVKFNEKQYDLKFIYNALLSLKLQKLAKGVKPGINRNDVYEIELSFPPLPEQKKIVGILDEVFAGIAKAKENAEKNLTNAREIFTSYLNSVFESPQPSWKKSSIKEVTNKIGSGATPTGGNINYKTSGISLIRSLNVYDEGFTEKDLAFIDEKQAGKLANVTIEPDDILLNITGASIARCCIVPEEILPARVNQHVSIIRLRKELIYPRFLHYLLIAKSNKDKLLKTGEKNGATRQALTKELIEKFEILYPPLSVQQSIVTKLDQLNLQTKKLEAIYQQKLADLEELKKSVLQQAFNGELTMGES